MIKFSNGSTWNNFNPIGMTTLAADEYETPENPRGWRPEIGQGSAMPWLQGIIAQAKGCQGLILWNVEGEYNGISYVGDPRFNPRSDLVAMISAIKSAGMIPGVMIRPTQVMADSLGRYRQVEVTAGGTDILVEKAKELTATYGQMIFYIDSNVSGVYASNGGVYPGQAACAVLQNVPNCLPIWEHWGDQWNGNQCVANSMYGWGAGLIYGSNPTSWNSFAGSIVPACSLPIIDYSQFDPATAASQQALADKAVAAGTAIKMIQF